MASLVKISFFLLLVVSFESCRNEIDANSDWKETAVVYGLLNVADSVQYIRVERVFQNGNGQGAMMVASEHDSIYFDTLKVEVSAYDPSGDSISTEIYKSDYTLKRDSGSFASSPNIIYTSSAKLNKDYSYKLKITSKMGNMFTSPPTYLVNGTHLIIGSMASPPTYFSTIPLATNDRFRIFVRSGKNAAAYDCILRFYIWNYDSIAADSFETIVDWKVATSIVVDINALDFAVQVNGQDFLDFIAITIPSYPHFARRIKYCDVKMVGASNDLFQYVSLNQPSLGIVQKKPEYSNILNGLGIFSSRETCQIDHLPLTLSTSSALVNDNRTSLLGFIY